MFFQKYISDVLSVPNAAELEKSMRVFPNPASDFIRIETSNEVQLYEVIIYTTLGTKMKARLNNESIDLAHLSPGIYFLMIKTSLGTTTRKIVKN